MASQFPTAPVLTDDGQPWPDQAGQMPQAPPADSGYWWPKVWNSIKSGATLPGDVATGQASMNDPATQARVGDMAGLVTLGAGALPAEEGALNMGIKAYHGSPHSFDQFDMSKIGTGEGAQAYGHGLYFADSEGVAKSYRDALATDPRNDINNYIQQVQDFARPSDITADNVKQGLARHENASIRAISSDPEMVGHVVTAAQGRNPDGTVTDAALKAYRSLDANLPKPAGHMYQVDIDADPEHFLDWDKRLSEQSPQVQQSLGKVRGVMPTPDDAAALHYGYDPTEFAELPAARQQQLIASTPPSAMEQLTQAKSGSQVAPKTFEGTWEFNKAGIPGIKYLDQGSRASGDGSRNYVVFNDALVKVLKKYGLAGGAGAAGAGALMNQSQPAQAAQFPQAPPY